MTFINTSSFFDTSTGTEKEKVVLTPQTKDYNQFGQDCVSVGCSVDLFLFNNAYIDIATISQVNKTGKFPMEGIFKTRWKITCGQITLLYVLS